MKWVLIFIVTTWGNTAGLGSNNNSTAAHSVPFGTQTACKAALGSMKEAAAKAKTTSLWADCYSTE